jgi:hypothetical protein
VKTYKVHIGYTAKGNPRYKRFATLEAACKFCNAVTARANIILSIVEA